VIYEVTWEEVALDQAVGFIHDDRDGVAAVLAAGDSLATGPAFAGGTSLGSAERFRLHVGRYRLWYDVDDVARTVKIVRCGRVS
jgi:mRNA interferase RelE/StbE